MSLPFSYDDFDFHPAIHLPDDVPVFDFTKEYDPQAIVNQGWGIGRYDEKRPHDMYVSDIYESGRNVHMGVDVWAPAGTPVFAVWDGEIYAKALNDNPRDYGPTLVTRHELNGTPVFALYGHLAERSLRDWTTGDPISRGEELAQLGTQHENGDWPPHLHFQISMEPPVGANMPGVVTEEQRAGALRKYPDPRIILGPIY